MCLFWRNNYPIKQRLFLSTLVYVTGTMTRYKDIVSVLFTNLTYCLL